MIRIGARPVVMLRRRPGGRGRHLLPVASPGAYSGAGISSLGSGASRNGTPCPFPRLPRALRISWSQEAGQVHLLKNYSKILSSNQPLSNVLMPGRSIKQRGRRWHGWALARLILDRHYRSASDRAKANTSSPVLADPAPSGVGDLITRFRVRNDTAHQDPFPASRLKKLSGEPSSPRSGTSGPPEWCLS